MARNSFDKRALAKLPLAESITVLLRHILPDHGLETTYTQHRGRSYQDTITFPHLVHLMADAVTRNVSFADALEACEDDTDSSDFPTRQAFYSKLSRLPLSLSLGFFRDCVQRIHGLHAPGMTTNDRIPTSLRDLPFRIMDGKKIKHVAKRGKAARGQAGAILGAVILAGFDPHTQLVDMIQADLDGDVNECMLVEGFLASIPSSVTQPFTMIADAQFGDLQQPLRLLAAGQHFLLRRSGKMGFHPDPQRPAKEYIDGQGRTVREEWGKISSDPQAITVRHLTVLRPDDDPLWLFTDLLEEKKHPALDLLLMYGMRWDIETMYQEVTMVFGLRHLIGSSPQAIVFQTMFCFLLANLMYVMQGYLAAAGQKKCTEVSTKKLMKQTTRQVQAMSLFYTPTQWISLLPPPMKPEELKQWLTEKLDPLWRPYYVKAVEKKKRTPKPKKKLSGAHHSAYRLIQQYNKTDQQDVD